MRPLRRLLARSLFAPFLLLPLLSCGYPKPSPKAVAGALGRAATFADPKTAVVPRRIEAKTEASEGGGALDDRQLAKIDPVIAILHSNKLVDIQDVYGPEPNTGGYSHVLSITLAINAPLELFVETEDPIADPAWQPIHKTPGWRVTLGRREVVTVGQIIDSSSPIADKLSPGYVLAEFQFHWIPNDIGKLFDQGSPGFDALPQQLQVATVSAADLDSRATYNARAWLTRDKNGEWQVTLFDCRRCTTQS